MSMFFHQDFVVLFNNKNVNNKCVNNKEMSHTTCTPPLSPYGVSREANPTEADAARIMKEVLAVGRRRRSSSTLA